MEQCVACVCVWGAAAADLVLEVVDDLDVLRVLGGQADQLGHPLHGRAPYLVARSNRALR